MSSVLITGHNGFLGKHLCNYILTETDLRIYTPEGDLTEGLPDADNYDYIVNLASFSSVEKSIADPVKFIENNVSSTLQVLEYARKHPPKIFLHFSTVEVYSPSNPYAASKVAQEAICSAYQNTYGIPVVVATSSNIVGEGQSHEKFVPKVIDTIMSDQTVSIYTQNGTLGYRIYNPVLNVVDAILFILKLPPPTTFTRYDIDGGEELTNLEMAQLLAKRLGKKLKYRTVEAENLRPGYTRHLVTDGTPLTSMGWQPPLTLKESLAWV